TWRSNLKPYLQLKNKGAFKVKPEKFSSRNCLYSCLMVNDLCKNGFHYYYQLPSNHHQLNLLILNRLGSASSYLKSPDIVRERAKDGVGAFQVRVCEKNLPEGVVGYQLH